MPRFAVRVARPPEAFFEPGPSGWHDAVLEGGEGSWSLYAIGYYRGATVLLEEALEPHAGRDLLIFPILFLYRQYVELSLKMLVRDLQDLTCAEPMALSGTHALTPLWSKARKLLAEIEPPDVFDAERATMERLVEEFETLDPGSFTFRYPETKDGSPVGYVVSRIDLARLRAEIENAHLAIETLTSAVVARLDQRNEFRGEIGP